MMIASVTMPALTNPPPRLKLNDVQLRSDIRFISYISMSYDSFNLADPLSILLLGSQTTLNNLKLQYMKLSALKSKHIDLFTLDQAKREGLSSQLLTHYLKKGLIERVSHGVYRLAGSGAIDLDSLIREKLKAIPQGVVGYKTALRIYNLTEEVHAEIDIVVPATNIPKLKLEDVTLHPVKTEIYKKDVQKVRGIPVTSLERTLVDLMRAGEPMSLIVNACREADRKRMPVSLSKLKKLGLMFRAKRKVDLLIGVLL